MLTLGIETSCDETSCSVVFSGHQILSNLVASQDIHNTYGGVVPELASRAHLDVLPNLLLQTLKEAEVSLQSIDLIAVANTPGLMGALSVGVNVARGLSVGTKKPVIGVNHVEAHIYAAYMSSQGLSFPALGLVVSGAHTALFHMESPTTYQLIGSSRDDALGEVFDKVARFLGLPYPGGALLEHCALKGNENAFPFPSSNLPNYDLSFSGLKTAVLYAIKGKNSDLKTPFPQISEKLKNDLAASFQKAACLTITKKISSIIKRFSYKSVLVGGGVANNQYLRHMLAQVCDTPLFFPPPKLCSDNAAMIAGLGTQLFLENKINALTPCTRHRWENISLPSL